MARRAVDPHVFGGPHNRKPQKLSARKMYFRRTRRLTKAGIRAWVASW